MQNQQLWLTSYQRPYFPKITYRLALGVFHVTCPVRLWVRIGLLRARYVAARHKRGLAPQGKNERNLYLRCRATRKQGGQRLFLVTAKQLKPKKNGEPYLDLTFSDSAARSRAKMWDNVAGASERFDVNDVIRVKGVFNRYNGRFQFTIRYARGQAGRTRNRLCRFPPKTTRHR